MSSSVDQLLSRLGYCSRREAAHWIRAQRIHLGKIPATRPDEHCDPHLVTVDGEPLDHPEGLLLALHKPVGWICSRDTNEGVTVYDPLPERWLRRSPPLTTVGRLDKETSGLLLLTDFGALVHQWTSPRQHVAKIYEVTVDRELAPDLVTTLASGKLQLRGEKKPCLPALLTLLGPCQARLVLHEGRYHQVRRLFASQGYQVTRLHRSAYGEFSLETLALPVGKFSILPLPIGNNPIESEPVIVRKV